MLRRGRTVFLCGVLVSAVTCLFMWEERIVFGVLTFHGAAMLLTWAAKPLLERVPDTAGILANAAAFYVTKGINEGYLQAGSVRLALPAALYRNYLTTFAGFPFPGFYSTDYFSLIPWIFLFLCGFYTARLAKKRGWLESPCMYYNIPVFSIMGRHSLLLYLVHQPVLYLLLQAVMAAGIL